MGQNVFLTIHIILGNMKRRPSQQLPTSFLQKTFDMLSDESLCDIVSWSDDGSAFVIKNVNEFSEQVLPRFFKHSNLASFVRQLNMYDFHKCRGGRNEQIFKHNLFLKGRPDLLKDIHRKTSEKNWPLLPKSSLSRSELGPIFQKLYQLYRKSLSSQSNIRSLEDRVSELTDQNHLLMNQLWDTQERMKQMEKVMLMLATFIQNGNSSLFNHMQQNWFKDTAFSLSNPPSQFMLTEEAFPTKKAKLDDSGDTSLTIEELFQPSPRMDEIPSNQSESYNNVTFDDIINEDPLIEDNIDLFLSS